MLDKNFENFRSCSHFSESGSTDRFRSALRKKCLNPLKNELKLSIKRLKVMDTNGDKEEKPPYGPGLDTLI